MEDNIRSMAFSCDNQSAFICDYYGSIKLIKWKTDANSGNDFYFSEDPKEVGFFPTHTICLTKDDKYLLVGSYQLVSVFETKTREVKTKFEMGDAVTALSLIKDGKQAIIAEYNSNLSILDLETMEISSIAENITNDMQLTCFSII